MVDMDHIFNLELIHMIYYLPIKFRFCFIYGFICTNAFISGNGIKIITPTKSKSNRVPAASVLGL